MSYLSVCFVSSIFVDGFVDVFDELGLASEKYLLITAVIMLKV